MFGRIVLLLGLATTAAYSQSFKSRELLIPSHAGNTVGLCQLGATFLKPVSPVSKSLVLFVHGSGTSNRNEQSPSGHRPFKDIAEGLSRQGIATLRFDKRGIQPECRAPLLNNQNLSPWHFVRDVINIIAYVKTQPEMKNLPLILLGHSEGVNFATEIAAKSPQSIKALVLLAGLGKYPIDQTILRQYRQFAQDPRLPAGDKLKIQKVINEGTAFFTKVHSGSALPSDQFMSIYSKYWIDWITITRNATRSAYQVLAPSLVIRGTSDTNVTADDFEALKAVTGHVPGSSSWVGNGLDHLLSAPGTSIVAPSVTSTIATWINSL